MEWRVQEQGPRAVIEVWRADKGDGLYKAHLVGPTGRCLLGILMPEGGRLFLRRTVSIASLQQKGVWPIRQVEEELVCSFHEKGTDIRWEDEVLRRCARDLPRHTVRRDGEGFSLVFPFDLRAPFPLLPAFCFGRVENGRLIFSFRKGGTPYILDGTGKNREELKGERSESHGKSDHQGTQRAGRPVGF